MNTWNILFMASSRYTAVWTTVKSTGENTNLLMKTAETKLLFEFTNLNFYTNIRLIILFDFCSYAANSLKNNYFLIT